MAPTSSVLPNLACAETMPPVRSRTPSTNSADLNGVRLPGSMSAEFVEGVRDRTGGMVSAQAKLGSTLEVGATAFFPA